MLQAKLDLEMEPSDNSPMAIMGATPMSKYGQNLKSSRSVVRTYVVPILNTLIRPKMATYDDVYNDNDN